MVVNRRFPLVLSNNITILIKSYCTLLLLNAESNWNHNISKLITAAVLLQASKADISDIIIPRPDNNASISGWQTVLTVELLESDDWTTYKRRISLINSSSSSMFGFRNTQSLAINNSPTDTVRQSIKNTDSCIVVWRWVCAGQEKNGKTKGNITELVVWKSKWTSNGHRWNITVVYNQRKSITGAEWDSASQSCRLWLISWWFDVNEYWLWL